MHRKRNVARASLRIESLEGRQLLSADVTAVADFSAILEIDADDVPVRLNRGIAEKRRGRRVEAAADFRGVIERSPEGSPNRVRAERELEALERF